MSRVVKSSRSPSNASLVPSGDQLGSHVCVSTAWLEVRFVSPVKVGSRIRGRAVTANAELKGNTVEVTRNFTVEIEGEEKPALVAEWVVRTVYG